MGALASGDHIIQGEYRISDRPDSVLTTLLGSCVAACIWDPVLKIGGMNHFLLPGEDDAQIRDSERYGVHLMELLVNGLLREGASRQRLQAKLFGGGNMNSALADIGARNAIFARGFLRNEGIALLGESLGGDRARKVQFWPTTGRARQMQLPKDVQLTDNRRALAPVFADSGSVELF
ncbi:MAG: cheD [Hyphomicrobiales bacterium]|nr:cheD [Hyphomicrobiales bacterium]